MWMLHCMQGRWAWLPEDWVKALAGQKGTTDEELADHLDQ